MLSSAKSFQAEGEAHHFLSDTIVGIFSQYVGIERDGSQSSLTL